MRTREPQEGRKGVSREPLELDGTTKGNGAHGRVCGSLTLGLSVVLFVGIAPLFSASAAEPAEADRMVNALDDIDEKLRLLEDELVTRQKELTRVRAMLTAAELELSLETDRAIAKKTELEKNMKALYAFGQAGYVSMVFSSTSLVDTLKRGDYLGRLIAYNRGQLEAYVRKVGELEARRVDLEKKRRRAVDEEAAVRAKIRGAFERRSERMAIIARIKKDPQLQAVMARESLKQTRRLDETVTAAADAARAAPAGGFAGKKGTLRWPARGVVEAGFGMEEDEVYGAKRQRKGWDIRARFLSEVVAIADGSAAHVGWMRGYGNVLVIDHGDGFLTINAHLARAEKAVGDRVTAGEVVGFVGDTASNKGPFLYFEIRHKGKPLDPAEWLERK